MQKVRLRPWKESDRKRFAEMNADSRVMEFFPSTLDRLGSDAFFDRLKCHIDEKGWGLWAVDVSGEMAGFTGLNEPSFEAHFTPCVEVGWRLRPEYWGRGIATTAAFKALQYGFKEMGLEEIVSFTAERNESSRRLMQRLGMTRDEKEDFDHPRLQAGHWLRPHVLYRIRRERFRRIDNET